MMVHPVYLTASVDNMTAPLFVFVETPTLGQKKQKNALDTACLWCKLIVQFICILPRKCGFCPKKEGTIALFLGAVNSSRLI